MKTIIIVLTCFKQVKTCRLISLVINTMINPDVPDLVAVWKIPLPHGLQVIEFEHGETSGRRIIRVNGEEVIEVT